jgi:hypothetical protein
MAYVSGYDNDVFVSYAHVDDRPLPPARDGWVSTLVDALKVLLAQQLGRAELCAVWRDLGLAGNAPLTPEIFAAIRGSAVMLLVLSEGYLASEWCRREHSEFLAMIGQGSRRFFVVERMPIERARWPVELQDLTGYPFWVRERSDLPARTLGMPTPLLEEREYYNRLNRLATELAAELKRIKAARS